MSNEPYEGFETFKFVFIEKIELNKNIIRDNDCLNNFLKKYNQTLLYEKKLKTQNRHLLNFLVVNNSPEVLKHVENTNLSDLQQKLNILKTIFQKPGNHNT
jgi:hypothetical protein